MFFSPSVRTHLSFVAAASELGGHAEYMSPAMARFKSKHEAGETIEDAAKVISGYMSGIGIRAMESALTQYREGHNLIREYAKYASVPVINMADDVCHPCQAMSDVLGWAERFSVSPDNMDIGSVKGKNLLVTWGKGALARSWNSPQASLLLASRFGMNIVLARPDGYDMDSSVYEQVRNNCRQNGASFNITNDPDFGYEGAHVVYSRNWITSKAYDKNKFNRQDEIEQALSYIDWITSEERMKKTDNAIFTHPMPVDRGYEVDSSVASGPQSVIYSVAENRLFVQKALISLIMCD